MHVGLILEHSDPRRGGAERYAADLAARLRLHGHRVTVCSRTGPAARPVPAWPAALRPLYYARHLLPLLRREGADVVFSLAPVPGCDVFQPRNGILRAAIPPHLEPVPEPWRTLRRLNPLRRLHFRLLERFEARTVAPPCRFLASSPLVAEHFRQRYPALPRPPILRTGVDLERFAPAARTERDRLGLPGGPLLLFVGHSFDLKGLRTALRALAGLARAHLCVVGEGRAAPFRRLAARLGVAERVRWRGPEPEPERLYRAGDVLVHPTHYDTAARVVLEALASGVPAVTTTRDGNADLAREGGGEVLADPRDAEGLAAAVERLLAVDRATRAERARAVAERHPAHTWLDRTVEAITCGSTS
ncbi:MAG: glycosyltransferase family 4 protein [Planctomycetota bacterium]|jgi:UDP-glucose:(heptosyl)LPS alpha-1,3-glucosyltransferase